MTIEKAGPPFRLRVRDGWRRASLVTAGILAPAWFVACGERITGPQRAFQLGALRPALFIEGEPAPFPAGSLTLALRTPDGAIVADTVLAVPEGSGDIVVALQVSVASGITTLFADASLAQGATTLFSVARTPVELQPIGASAPPPSPLTMAYVGPGAGTAASVRITAPVTDGFTGDTVALQGEVLDGQGVPIAGVPILWSVRDTLRVRVPGLSDGRAVLGGVRGPAQVFLRTYTGLVDSVAIGVAPLPTAVQAVGTFPRADTVGAPMGAPVGVRLVAADQLPVAGIDVRFVLDAGGTTVLDSLVRADANGEASVTPVLPTTTGDYTLTATPQRGSGAATLTLTALPDAPATLVLGGGPGTELAAGETSPALQVSVRDQYGNVVTSFIDTVTVRLLDGTGAEVSPPVRVPAVQGVATLAALAPTVAGSGLRYSVTAAGLVAVETAPFTVRPGPAAALTLSGAPGATIVAGTTLAALAVEARDAFGNLATDLATPISAALGVNPTGAALEGTTSVAPSGGRATFDALRLTRAGSGYTVVFSTGALATAPTSAFDVTAAAPTALRIVSGPAATVVAGEALAPLVVGASDAYGNAAGALGGTVSVALGANPGGTTLGGTLTANPVGGLATFSDLLVTRAAAGYTLAASAPGLTGVTSPAFSVEPAAAAALTITTQPPATLEAGSPVGPVTLDVVDAFGNLVPAWAQPIVVAFAANPGDATLGGTASLAPAGGSASFTDLLVTRAEAGYTLAFSSGALTGATTTPFTVTPGPAASLAFDAEPAASITAGSVVGPLTVTASDAYGNLATGFAGSVAVTFGANPGATTLGGTDTVAATAGVATFGDLVVTRAAAGYTLAASSGVLVPDTTTAFAVTAAAASRLAFTTQPPPTLTAGTTFPALSVEVQDPYGNRATWADTVVVDLAANPANGTLAGTVRLAAAAGAATFGDLTLTRAGAGYTLAAASGALTAATSDAFTVTAAAATQLVVAQGPADGAQAGDHLSPIVVEARDPYANVDPSFTGVVTLSFATNPTASILVGDSTEAAVAGVATFARVGVGMPGAGYALRASAGGVGAGQSTAFTAVTPVVPMAVKTLTTGSGIFCGLGANGSIYCWGTGTLGNGDTQPRWVPTAVQSPMTFEAVSAGNGFVCAVATSREAYCWGSGGRLGDGSGTSQLTPVLVSGGHRWGAIATGTLSTCGLTDAGVAYCWGENSGGRLGDGTETNRLVPTPVALNVRFTQLSMGGFHACGLTAAGYAYCWGINSGRIGDGTTVNRLTPVPLDPAIRWQRLDLDAGGIGQSALSCGLSVDGDSYCWGNDSRGERGTGSVTNLRVNAPEPGAFLTPWRSLTATGAWTACGVDALWRAYCWGANGGRFGDGGTADSPLLTSVVGLPEVTTVVPNASASCAIARSGEAYCWGIPTTNGILGDDGAYSLVRTAVGGRLPSFLNLAIGTNHLCGVSSSQGIQCLGAGQSAQLGNGTTPVAALTPVAVTSSAEFTRVTAGQVHSCGLTSGGDVLCWGSAQAALGSAATTTPAVPTAVPGAPRFSSFASGANHNCGLALADSVAYCWGFAGAGGVIGNGSTTTGAFPVTAVGTGRYVAVDAGGFTTCTLDVSSAAFCWGSGFFGQIGDGSTSTAARAVPTRVAGAIAFRSISPGGNHTCAVSTTGVGYCWGSNTNGELGGGSVGGSVPSPQAVGGSLTFDDIRAGNGFSCGLTTAGEAHCWGLNATAQLGDGTLTSRSSPTRVVGAPPFTRIQVGSGAACGTTSSNETWCWGGSLYGRLGLGAPLTAVPVAGGVSFRVP